MLPALGEVADTVDRARPFSGRLAAVSVDHSKIVSKVFGADQRSQISDMLSRKGKTNGIVETCFGLVCCGKWIASGSGRGEGLDAVYS